MGYEMLQKMEHEFLVKHTKFTNQDFSLDVGNIHLDRKIYLKGVDR